MVANLDRAVIAVQFQLQSQMRPFEKQTALMNPEMREM